ncbi:ATP6V1E1.2 family protein [Megaselia abdita]
MSKIPSCTSNIFPIHNDEVLLRIREMVKFIDQDATEKIEELEVLAEEQVKIEKHKIVKIQQRKLDELQKIRMDVIKVQMNCQESRMWNEYSLNQLQTQTSHVEDVISRARNVFTDISNNPLYKVILKKLIIQASQLILSPNVIVITKEKDQAIVNSILKDCMDEFRETLNMECRISLETNRFLPKSVYGGIQVITSDGKVSVMNTLEKRLELICHQLLPYIKYTLFKQ